MSPTPGTFEVTVFKANIPLMEKESIQDFSRKASDAAREYFIKAMNLSDRAYTWSVQLFQDKGVFSVDDYPPADSGKKSVYKTMMLSFTRDKDGKFSFSDMKEVKPVTTYEPVESNLKIVTKAADGTQVEVDAVETLKMAHNRKTFWGGIIR